MSYDHDTEKDNRITFFFFFHKEEPPLKNSKFHGQSTHTRPTNHQQTSTRYSNELSISHAQINDNRSPISHYT